MQHMIIGLMRSQFLVQKFTHTVLCETVRFVVSDVFGDHRCTGSSNFYNCLGAVFQKVSIQTQNAIAYVPRWQR